ESKIQEAFQRLIDTCDAMRTVFVEKEGRPQQKILAHFPYEMAVVDFSQQPAEVAHFLKEKSQRQFDLEQCLFEAILVKMAFEKYIWYFNQHHLITDAWSTTQQYQAFITYYQQLLTGVTITSLLPPFESYIEFEALQRSQLATNVAADYWTEAATDLPEPVAFYGQTNSLLKSHSKRISLTLSKEKSDLLRQLTKEVDLRTWTEHFSLFSIFSTVFFAYLYRITGQQKLAIGTPAHNRTTNTFKKTPGLFIELFPLTTAVEAGDTFSTLFQKVRNKAHEFLRYAQAGTSSSALNRSFNVVLNYINASFPDFNGEPTTSNWIHSDHADPGHHFRLQVYDFDASGCIELGFDLNTAVFTKGQLAEVPTQFLKLLDSFLVDRFQPIEAPALQDTPLVFEENTTTSFSFEETSVLALFERKVAEIPADKVAIRFGGKQLTYQQLDQHANQLAHFLLTNKVAQGDTILLFLPRSPEFIICSLAAMKVGATFVPVPTNYPIGRVMGIMEDAQPRLVLTNSVLSKRFPLPIPALIELDQENIFIQQAPLSAPTILPSLEATTYLMYTSGSTGQPKGVMISARSLSHYIQWAAHAYIDGYEPVVPLFTAVGFDLTITSMFLPLILGGSIVTYQEPETGPDFSLLEVLSDNKANFIKLTPSHLALLQGKSFSNNIIKTMIVGGENFKTDAAQFVQQQFNQQIKIYNEYGPTEATVGCVVHAYDEQKDQGATSVPIGLPIDHTYIYILDEFQNPVPAGITGELYVGGIGVAQGYWRNTALSDEKFISDPFKDGKRIYRTGDLVRKHPVKNYLEYLGRKDQQVKIRGRRVELAEIETMLNLHPSITQGIVELRHRRRAKKVEDITNCITCGLPSNYPAATFNDKGVCHLCQSFEQYQDKVKKYFKTKTDLKALFENVSVDDKGEYDCIMLLSGGKDSTYALAQLKEMGLRVLAFTLDNGYISQEALANVKRVVTTLGVDYVIGQTEAMNAIFVDSLQRHCNVCDGCFKTIYTLSVQLALEKKIPFIVTGLSRGQFFETRLTQELFDQPEVDVDKIDEMILNARKAYHQVDDAVKELLDTSMFDTDEVFEKVQFIDFYRYTDVSLQEMLVYLQQKLPWVRPSDTGRSTNCLINQAGIYVHKKELGYSNYAFPYSWDVRIGHKTRKESLEEINEKIDEKEVFKILDEIGYSEADQTDDRNEQLVAYYVGETIAEADLKNYLKARLPDYMIPVQFIQLETFPLTVNGKIDKAALPLPDAVRPVVATKYQAPQTEFEEIIQSVWSEVMGIDKIGIYDTFIDLGGDSLQGIQVVSRLNAAFELDLPVNLIFQKPTIAQLAVHIEAVMVELLQALEDA
ncbi:MAG: amino acid adenylation domain-containing protein, partial [Bacteroidota bacterium]